MDEYRETLNTLDKVLAVQSKHIKALYIKGKTLLLIGETQSAVQTLSQATQLDPANQEVRKELAKAQAKHKVQYESEKQMYKKMMSGVSKSQEADERRIDKLKKSSAKRSAAGNNNNNNSSNNNNSNIPYYLMAGLAVALVSVGVALFSRYKN